MRKLLPLCTFLLAAFFTCQIAKADVCNGFTTNLVTNCSFETGTFTGWSGSAVTGVYNGVDKLAPYVGTYEAYLGDFGTTGTLSQTLATIIGQTYTVDFALMNDTSYTSGYPNSFTAMFGSSVLLSESDVVASAYKLYTFTTTATSASTTLSFTDLNDAGYFDLDSVSVSAAMATTVTPEPGSLLLTATGLMGVMFMMRRRLMA